MKHVLSQFNNLICYIREDYAVISALDMEFYNKSADVLIIRFFFLIFTS